MSKSEIPTRAHPSMRDRGFTVLDNKIFDNLNISALARLLLMYLVRYHTCPNFTAYSSTKMKWLGCKRKKLQLLHKELVDQGYMRLITGGIGGGSWYEFHAEPIFLKASEEYDQAHDQSERSKKGQSQKGTVPKTTPILNTDLPINTDLRKQSKDHPMDDPSPFDKFWKEYPRKVTKGRAVTAFKAALKKVTVETMIDALNKQKAWRASKGPKDFVPDWKHPSSWLNGECWADELDVPAKGSTLADEVRAYVKTAPRAHKTEEETKQELERRVPPARANAQHVSGLMEAVRKDLGKANMEKGNVRNHSGRVVPTVEQRNRDSGQEFITPGSATA